LAHRFHLHLITDRKQARGEPAKAAISALKGGVDCVQVREKGGPAKNLYDTALEITPHARDSGARVLVNDRADVAVACGADGVHLASKSLPPETVRGMIGGKLLGVSVHSLEEAQEAVAGGADYVTFGHVYPTSSKPGMQPQGVRQLAGIVEAVEVPVLAIGGIDTANIEEVLTTGASGIAVISAIVAAEDPESEARKLRRALDESSFYPRHPFPESEGVR
jgi:thiamine-phosphate pyrophosphorylase